MPEQETVSSVPLRRLKINIRRSDRMFVVGTTGSGKSYLLRKLAAPLPYVVVVDPKHQWDWEDTRPAGSRGLVTSKLEEVMDWEEPEPVVYRPGYVEAREGIPEFFLWVFLRGNTLVVIDEVMSLLSSPSVLPRDFGIVIQQGRSRNIGLWMATQRPSRIPIPVLSESEHHCIFRLRHPNDLRRMAEYTDPIVEQRPARGHQFWYYNDRTQQIALLDAKMIMR